YFHHPFEVFPAQVTVTGLARIELLCFSADDAHRDGSIKLHSFAGLIQFIYHFNSPEKSPARMPGIEVPWTCYCFGVCRGGGASCAGAARSGAAGAAASAAGASGAAGGAGGAAGAAGAAEAILARRSASLRTSWPL